MNVSYDNFIGIYEGAFSADYCQKAIKYFEDMVSSGYSQNRQQTENALKLNKDDESIFTTSEDIINLIGTKALQQEFNAVFWNSCMPDYTNKYAALKQIPKLGSYLIKMQRTGVGQGYHVWHFEDSGREINNRTLAWALYLNDVEEGGETEFLYQHKRIAPKAGTVVIWPAAFTHAHRGNPPLSGTKYIMTGWVEQ